jgi:hypothetical protein
LFFERITSSTLSNLTFVCFINLNRIDKYKDNMIEKQTKIAAAAQASAAETLDRAKAMKGRFTTFTDKKAKELARVRQSAKKKVAAINKAHTRELERQNAQSVRDSRATSKKVVALESNLVTQQRNHEKDTAAMEKQHTNEMKNIKSQNAIELSKSAEVYEKDIRLLQSSNYREARTATKEKVALEASLEAAVLEKEEAIATKDVAVKAAVKATRAVERQQAASKVSVEKDKVASLSSRLAGTRKIVESVLEGKRQAEREARRSSREADQSAKRSKSLNEVTDEYRLDLEKAESENATLREALEEMQALLDEQERRLDKLDKAVPIKVLQKTREGSKGRPRWGLDVWELIIEQLVNGTPPSAVNDNIISNVKKFSPTTQIKELPSIWTIRRARTVLLVIVQTLAAYRLGLAGKWGQLNHDATSRRQISFENLVISVEEDELFQ